jgi:Kef-type K+ transport system membrane component KefB
MEPATLAAHADPAAAVALWMVVILLSAKLGADLAVRIGQPPVLGELLAGVVLGNLSLLGIGFFEPMKHDVSVELLAKLGVLILLFEVGLESTVAQMLKVGVSSFLVACIGVAGPFALGWWIGGWLMPDAGSYVHAYVGATLTATSVGITARVLRDLRRGDTPEARIILGAAVIDDVLGLLILAVVAGAVISADGGVPFTYVGIAWTLAKAVGFLAGAIVLGLVLSPRILKIAGHLRGSGVLLATGLSLCFLFAWLADRAGLAAIVGAYAAGLILEDAHARRFTERGEDPIQRSISPIGAFLVPFFFVRMGLLTDLTAFGDPRSLGLAIALFVVAVIGKQASSLGAIGKGLDRISIGVGMIPRGEVGLIFADVGRTLTLGGAPMVDVKTFSAIVVMVILTTLATPPLLKWSLGRRS